jgi:hypothetical protein
VDTTQRRRLIRLLRNTTQLMEQQLQELARPKPTKREEKTA